MSDPAVLGVTAAAVLVLMVATWAVSVAVRNASIVDIVWGFGFVVVAVTTRLAADGHSARQTLLTVLTAIWGLRLAGYLFWRNHGKGEDWRYAAMRRKAGPTFARRSLVTVFGVQGVLMWVVSLPVQLGQFDDDRGAVALIVAGVIVWAIGLTFEAVGDAQLARFKSDPANKGQLMDQGLWRYTRHPNYFGDCCVWWGLFLIAAATPVGWLALPGPVLMTVLLRRVSGVTLLEKSLTKRKPGYDEYVARTSAFFPRPPRTPRS